MSVVLGCVLLVILWSVLRAPDPPPGIEWRAGPAKLRDESWGGAWVEIGESAPRDPIPGDRLLVTTKSGEQWRDTVCGVTGRRNTTPEGTTILMVRVATGGDRSSVEPVEYRMPDPIPDTPENIARAVLGMNREGEW